MPLTAAVVVEAIGDDPAGVGTVAVCNGLLIREQEDTGSGIHADLLDGVQVPYNVAADILVKPLVDVAAGTGIGRCRCGLVNRAVRVDDLNLVLVEIHALRGGEVEHYHLFRTLDDFQAAADCAVGAPIIRFRLQGCDGIAVHIDGHAIFKAGRIHNNLRAVHRGCHCCRVGCHVGRNSFHVLNQRLDAVGRDGFRCFFHNSSPAQVALVLDSSCRIGIDNYLGICAAVAEVDVAPLGIRRALIDRNQLVNTVVLVDLGVLRICTGDGYDADLLSFIYREVYIIRIVFAAVGCNDRAGAAARQVGVDTAAVILVVIGSKVGLDVIALEQESVCGDTEEQRAAQNRLVVVVL